MSQIKKITALTLLASGMSTMAFVPTAQAEDDFYKALSEGKVSFSARLRYEGVDDENNTAKEADALTLRTTLGYKTGMFHGFSAFGELEDVTDIGSVKYNSLTNGKTGYDTVVDPEGTEVNQAYLQYNGFDTEFKLGRQEITYRDAPFHRFVGNVLWRQNHQSFDAFSFTNTSLPDTKISYAYINKVQTIFGEDRTAAAAYIYDGEIDMNSHLFNIQYTGLPIGKLEGYSYLLDYADAPDNNTASTATYGLRLSGAKPVNDAFTAVYTAEFATQGDYADGQMDDQNYYLAELGGKYKGWLAKFSYEMQEGDGTYSFKTPLGTNHAFQGWADQFLSTPAKGLQDMYFTVAGNVLGAKVVGVYHDFETDQGSLDAGSELDLLAEKTFNQHYTLGVKYADYNGSSEIGKADVQKFWVYGMVKF